MINLDLALTAGIDVCGRAEQLLFQTGSFSVIVSQETLEHVSDPDSALREMHRVLAEGGCLYCQLPFIIGYHPGPTDFWRWSREGLIELLARSGFACEQVGMVAGPATGLYRILVEGLAVFASCAWSRLYLPVKGLAALGLWPLKLLDRPMAKSPQADRIAAGYWVIARKRPC